MKTVLIDGIEYVPKCDIPELTDDRLNKALQGLTAMLYFREEHKSMAHAWDILNDLAPDLAKIAADSPKKAYDMVHPELAEFLNRTIEELSNTVIKTEKIPRSDGNGTRNRCNYFFELTVYTTNRLKELIPARKLTLYELLEHRDIDLFQYPNIGKKVVEELIKALERASSITGKKFALRDKKLTRSDVVDELMKLRHK